MSLASHKGKNNFELGNKSYTSRGGDTTIYDITSSSGGGGGERTKALINLQDLWSVSGQNWITDNNNGNYNTFDVPQLINSLSNTPPPERRDQADPTYPGYDNNWHFPGDGTFVHAASDIWIIRSIEFNMIGEQQSSLSSMNHNVRRTFETYVHDTVDIVPQDQLNHTRNGRWTHIGDGYGARRWGDKLHLLSGGSQPFLKYFYLEIRGAAASTGGSGEGGVAIGSVGYMVNVTYNELGQYNKQTMFYYPILAGRMHPDMPSVDTDTMVYYQNSSGELVNPLDERSTAQEGVGSIIPPEYKRNGRIEQMNVPSQYQSRPPAQAYYIINDAGRFYIPRVAFESGTRYLPCIRVPDDYIVTI